MMVLDAIIQSLSRASEYNRDDPVAPAVVLWPDQERQWEPVLPVRGEHLPHLLTLGLYAAMRLFGGLAVLMLIGTMEAAQVAPSASEVLAKAKVKAEAEHKTIFVLFDASW